MLKLSMYTSQTYRQFYFKTIALFIDKDKANIMGKKVGKLFGKLIWIVLLLLVLSFTYQTLGFLLQVLEELPVPIPGGFYDITDIKPNFWLHLLIFILLLSLLMAGVWLLFRKPKRRIYFYIAVIFIVLLLVIDILRIVPKL